MASVRTFEIIDFHGLIVTPCSVVVGHRRPLKLW